MKQQFKIEKNVPVPLKRGGTGPAYPWPAMKVDDSIFVPGKKTGAFSTPYLYGKAHGLKFVSRAVDGGVRVWRIK